MVGRKGIPGGAFTRLVNGFNMLGEMNTLRRKCTHWFILWLFSVFAMVLLVKDSHHFRLFLGASLILLLLGLAHAVYIQRRQNRRT